MEQEKRGVAAHRGHLTVSGCCQIFSMMLNYERGTFAEKEIWPIL